MTTSGFQIVTVTAAPFEPVSVANVRRQARIDIVDDDAFIAEIVIPAARDRAEQYLRRRLVAQTVRITWDGFPWWRSDQAFFMPWGPIRRITAIEYRDVDDAVTTLSATLYRADTDNEPCRVFPAYGELWPNTSGVLAAVSVYADIGYEPGASGSPTSEADYRKNIPPAIVQAILMDCAHLLEHRETVSEVTQLAETPHGWDALLYPYRLLT